MNIIIIGSARTKSTALLEKICLENPTLKNWGEPLEELIIKSGNFIIKNKDEYFENRLKKLFLNFDKPNNIIKILGNNFFAKTNYIPYLNLHKFDKIYLVERHNFFEQVCSFSVAREEKLFHLNRANEFRYDKMRQNTYTLKKFLTNQMASSIGHYLDMKKFVIENKLPYIQYTYEMLDEIKGINHTPVNLDYSKIISNYNLKGTMNDIFYKNYNYNTCEYNYYAFCKEMDNLLF